ncbi:MAG: tellurite resistance/C4-dicarboxylate transporter family protein [Phycisphaerales bacterium]|nr:tellurite resistance/C4-dicarboxylate transporter family protein [Phycisphaerales bacterium]
MNPPSPSPPPAAVSAARAAEAHSTLSGRVLAGARDLHPAYFALVMATGIISNACHLLGFHLIALALLWLNVVFYVSLWSMTAIRLGRFPSRFVADLRDHNRGVGFFTMIAGTCVLGSQCLIILALPELATGLWVLGLLLWIVLTYTVFASLTVKQSKPELARGINGGWLVAVVGTQAVSLLGGQVSHYLEPSRQAVLFASLMFWLGGGMLYVWIISLIFYRYTFFALEPSDLAPPYWINMGAMAISTLAGTVLIDNASTSALLESLAPFLGGVTLLFWATATWWIPMLIILGVWRHGYRRFPLRYDPLYWGAVFPLGMYTVCTYRLTQVLPVEFLTPLPRAFIYIALAAWALTFCGLIGTLARVVRGPRGNA